MSARPAAFRLKAETTRLNWATALLLCVAALLAPACHRAITPSAGAAKLEDFHYSDAKTIAGTGRPQLLEFVGPT